MPIIPWPIGPNELTCLVVVEVHPAERPHCGPFVEVYGRDSRVVENGKRRKLTSEEYDWLEEAEADIEAWVLSPT